jgi:hypothetical protein
MYGLGTPQIKDALGVRNASPMPTSRYMGIEKAATPQRKLDLRVNKGQ